MMEVDASDDVPFQMGDFSVNQPLIFRAVTYVSPKIFTGSKIRFPSS